MHFTREFIADNGLSEESIVSVSWLEENGRYCDCEALANAEEVMGGAVPGYRGTGVPKHEAGCGLVVGDRLFSDWLFRYQLINIPHALGVGAFRKSLLIESTTCMQR